MQILAHGRRDGTFIIRTIALATLIISAPVPASAQTRPFSGVPGIIVACQPAAAVSWTEEGCAHLITEMQRRGVAAKIAVSIQPSAPDFARRVFGETGGFAGDKAIRAAFTFRESTSVKGRVTLSLASYVVVEPKVPGAAPGQRIPMNFYSGDIQFEPGIGLGQAKTFIKTQLDGFFAYGEGRL